MKIAEILDNDGSEDGFVEWVVVYSHPDHIHLASEYQKLSGGDRKTWQDAGISVTRRRLRSLIEALEEAEKKIPEETNDEG